MKGQTVGWIGKQLVKPEKQGLDRNGEIFCLILAKSMKIGPMRLGDDPCLERIARGKRGKDQEMTGLQDDSPLGRCLFLEDIAKDAAFLTLIIIYHSPDLFIDPPWNHGHGHDMRVGMTVKYSWIIL